VMKRISGLLLLLIIVLCGVGCVMMSGDPQTTTGTEYVEPTTTIPEETEPPYRLMVITGSSLNIRSGPGMDYDAVGKLQKGDLAQVWEEIDGWGRIDQGWISLEYAEDYRENTDISLNQPDHDADPDEPTTSGSTTDKSQLLEGMWYRYFTFSDGVYFIDSREFRNGNVIDNSYQYSPDTGKMYNIGGSEGIYSYDGKYATIDCPPYAYNDQYLVSVSGNKMYWGTEKLLWQRVSLSEIQSQVKKELNGAATIDPAIIGSWYRVVSSETLHYVSVYTFDAQGNVKDAGIQYVPENPQPDNYMGSYTFSYTFDGTNLEIDGSSHTVSISGNRMILDGNTYKKGTVYDGFAELEQMLAPAETEPATEPVIETTTPATEAVAEP